LWARLFGCGCSPAGRGRHRHHPLFLLATASAQCSTSAHFSFSFLAKPTPANMVRVLRELPLQVQLFDLNLRFELHFNSTRVGHEAQHKDYLNCPAISNLVLDSTIFYDC